MSTAPGHRVVIVGGGPAGIRAAEVCVANGLHPVLVDEAVRVGGQVYRQRPDGLAGRPDRLYGFEARKAVALHETFERIRPQLDYRPQTLAWNARDGVVCLHGGGGFADVPFDSLILATGATDRVIPLRGWTMPGVYTLGGAQIALKFQACAVGSRTVFVGSTPLLYLVAYQYLKAGAGVVAVVDAGGAWSKLRGLPGLLNSPATLAKGLWYLAALRARGVPVLHAASRVEIDGATAVSGIRFLDDGGRRHDLACDAVAMGFHLRAEAQLAELAGCEFRYDPVARQWLPGTDEDGRAGNGIYLAGDGAKIGGADAAEAGGALAAWAALADRGVVPRDDPRIAALRRRKRRWARFQQGVARAFPFPVHWLRDAPDDLVLCRCEMVTVGDYRKAADTGLGEEDVNRRKAFCRAGMGRCQGRYCGLAAAELLAMQRGADPAIAGRLRAQAPVKPLPMNATTNEAGRAANGR